jgi:hypothetical protein
MVNHEKKVHFPLRLWKKPKKAVRTSEKYKQPLGRYAAWSYSRILSTKEAQFAFKTALAVSLTAMFQYIPATSSVFIDWRGEWGVVTVCSLLYSFAYLTLDTSNHCSYICRKLPEWLL